MPHRSVWRPWATAAALVGVVLAINGAAQRQVLAAPAEASQLVSFVLSGDVDLAMQNLLRPGSGEQALPREVLYMLALVRGRDIQAFSLSPRISADELWVQRITESAFPRRVVKDADNRLALVGEALPLGCRTVAVDHGVRLARCP